MDESTYIALCETELTTLYRMAMSVVRNRPDTEDAVQQALMKAWQHRGKAQPGKERAWLMRILVNECYTILRKRRTYPLEDAENIPAPTDGESELGDAIRALPETLRTPLLLKYMVGMTEKEVAASLRLPVSGVKNRLFRARKALKKLLSEEENP